MNNEQDLIRLGFRFGINGPHAARTMMLNDLRRLLSHTKIEATRQDYADAVMAENLLGKSTKKTRELAFRHLSTLYGLDRANPLFRAFRRLWSLDATSQPVLALMVALARDPLLRATESLIQSLTTGTPLPRVEVEDFLAQRFPDRFSAASLKSFAQNISGTWTDAGYLTGRRHKIRSLPVMQPEAVAFGLFLGYLEGRSGQRLFSSGWMRLLGGPSDRLEALANTAAQRGLLVFMNAGGVQEVRFPGYLTPEEEQIRQEVAHGL